MKIMTRAGRYIRLKWFDEGCKDADADAAWIAAALYGKHMSKPVAQVKRIDIAAELDKVSSLLQWETESND